MSDYKYNADRIRSFDVTPNSPSNEQVLLYDSDNNEIVWGDVDEDNGDIDAQLIQDEPVDPTSPSVGDRLVYDVSEWSVRPAEWVFSPPEHDPESSSSPDFQDYERILFFPAALLAGNSNLYEGNAYFHLTLGSGSRGDVSNVGTGTVYVDIPLVPWLREGDTILGVDFRVRRDGSNAVSIGLYRTTDTQSHRTISSTSATQSGWNDVSLPSSDFPYTLNQYEEKNLVAGTEIPDDSFRDNGLMWIKVWFLRNR